MRSQLHNTFWKQFAKRNWEKEPLLVKNFQSSILEIDENEIFEMLVAYSDRCRKLKSADGFKLFIDGARLHPDEVLQFLPDKKDRNLQNYHTRMEEYYTDYCLVCDELLQVSQKNWGRLNEFTQNLFSSCGFPNRFVEMGLYLGNYRKTPFGVHVDGCGVFSFPVVGKKTFRLWDPEFAKKNPSLDRARSYARFKKASHIMTAIPGDMAYWPSKSWHIAESNGSFTATWSLGVWVDRPHRDVITEALKPLMDMALGSDGLKSVTDVESSLVKGEVKALPKNYQQAITQIQKISTSQLNSALMRSWLQHLSLQGFKTTAFLKDRRLTLHSLIRIPPSTSILWTRGKNTRLFAYQGRVVDAQNSRPLQNLFNALNQGKVCRVGDYLKDEKLAEDLSALQRLLG